MLNMIKVDPEKAVKAGVFVGKVAVSIGTSWLSNKAMQKQVAKAVSKEMAKQAAQSMNK